MDPKFLSAVNSDLFTFKKSKRLLIREKFVWQVVVAIDGQCQETDDIKRTSKGKKMSLSKRNSTKMQQNDTIFNFRLL